MKNFDVIIIGAGASGLMCALTAGQRGKKVLLLEHENKIGKKILISGGGKCNFTNYDVSAENYISSNSHFCKSALSRYSQYDFLALIDKYDIAYEERNLGQLFCKHSAKDILKMLEMECYLHQVKIETSIQFLQLTKLAERFILKLKQENSDVVEYSSTSFVIATGGISIPKMGATDLGYLLAKQFGHHIIRTDPGLVPFELSSSELGFTQSLSGNAFDASVSCNGMSFRENILFTHKGLSGPAILQISNYWQSKDTIDIDFLPEDDLAELLPLWKKKFPQLELKTLLHKELKASLSKSFIKNWLEHYQLNMKVVELNSDKTNQVLQIFKQWRISPKKTLGYRVAEVTRGGVDTNEVSSKTLMSQKEGNLFIIGEVLDVTGWLGGYNFQWAWSSGYCAGLYV